MSRLIRIETALKGLEGGRFQNLCNELLFALGYGKVTKSGGQIGTDKPIKGTPDTYILLPNGKFIFVEYTTKEKNVYNKFLEDINKCFDEEKTGISTNDIEKIIVCYNTIMSADEVKLLSQKCAEEGCGFEHFDISVISQYLNSKYSYIAKEYFGIEFASGQVMEYDVFVKPQRNLIFSTPLDNEFMFRKDETKAILENLEKNDVVIIYGRAGVGKTRLSLEVMKQFVHKYPQYKIFCMSSNGQNIYNDLQIYFSNDSSYILLIDDANRFKELNNILDLLKKDNIKLILTLRDYALIEIKNVIDNFKHFELELDSLKDENIKEILMSKSIDITNSLYLDRICSISNGNPRLAIMAAKVAKEFNNINSLSDVSNIYKNYFSSILDKVSKEDINTIKVLGVICFFQNIERESSRHNQISQLLNVSKSDLWNIIIRLYELEVVDIYNNEVAKVSDQILATYFCYYTLIEESVLEFASILEEFFFTYKQKMIDVIYPMLNTFDFNKILNKIKPSIDNLWAKNENIHENFVDIIDVFWFVKPIETLIAIKSQIDLLPTYEGDIKFEFLENDNYGFISDFYIKILKKLTSYDVHFVSANELMFLYLEKKPDIFPQFMQFLKENIFYDYNSYYYDYNKQKDFLKLIIKKAESNEIYNDLLYNISFNFLKIHNNDTSESLFRKNQIQFRNFTIVLTDGMKELRKLLFEALLEIIDSPRIADFLNRYIRAIAYDFDKEIAIYDFSFIMDLLEGKSNKNDYVTCSSVNKYIDFLEFNGIEDDRFNLIRKDFINDCFLISKVLYDEYNKREWILEEKLSHQEIEKIRKQNISEYFKDYNIKDYYKLYDCLKTILSKVQNHTEYEYYTAIGYILEDLIFKDVDMYFEFIEYIMRNNNEIKITYPYSKVLSEEYPERYCELLAIIEKYNFEYKHEWSIRFFDYLPEKNINELYIKKLKDIYINLPPDCYIRFDTLERYYKYDSLIYYDILSCLSANLSKKNCCFRLISHIPDVLKKINNDYNLLKKIYLYSCRKDMSFDYSGETMQQMLYVDSHFIIEYLECLKGENKKDHLDIHMQDKRYKFIWDMDNYTEILNNVIQFFSNEDESSMVRLNNSWHYINKFFGFDKQKEKDYIKQVISKNSNNKNIMQLIFIPVSNVFFIECLEFVEVLFKYDIDFEIFRTINLSRGGRVTSNYEKDLEDSIKLWESFIPLTNSLDYIKHREYICAKVESYKKSLESERRRKYFDEH